MRCKLIQRNRIRCERNISWRQQCQLNGRTHRKRVSSIGVARFLYSIFFFPAVVIDTNTLRQPHKRAPTTRWVYEGEGCWSAFPLERRRVRRTSPQLFSRKSQNLCNFQASDQLTYQPAGSRLFLNSIVQLDQQTSWSNEHTAAKYVKADDRNMLWSSFICIVAK